MRSLVVILLTAYASFGCDIREASLVDMALDMEMPATICLRVLTSRTGEWALSNSFPEVWSAKMIRNAELASDNSVVCLHNTTLPTEYIIACRGTFCSLPMRKKDAIMRCTFTIQEMMLRINFFSFCYALFSAVFAYCGCYYETRPLPKWIQVVFAGPIRWCKKMGKKKERDSQKE
ncbi:hypothetical protein PRIPAC_93919 [Pristionchus pacificus]|uniref:Uncharacterized protein n=1 Tax=Pristionchus pacificus TaxID=54126 RepID=A0A2A6CI24_PRIPA|nr:hypothetical protein PRIPAC_93919 [Pristionchus pacificus]|eukprot:PDM77703.1 hypothetical protein PRIPAC_34570 [Pristionchus pacificus]